MKPAQKILIADDSPTVTTLLKVALETAGYDLEVAENGDQAYQLGKSGGFDLAILDQLMPGLLGLEVVKMWREEGVDLAVIMLSGVDDDRTVVESFDLGALDYIRKPFRIPEILARIKSRIAD